MNKIRGLIFALLGLLALGALVVGLSWLLGLQRPRLEQQMSPLRTPTPRPVGTAPANRSSSSNLSNLSRSEKMQTDFFEQQDQGS